MRLNYLGTVRANKADGKMVEIAGWPAWRGRARRICRSLQPRFNADETSNLLGSNV
ncbi:MAG: hypothetical protein KIT25_00550 [Enhydrobacter sp.]|nr:MAG: hypothetical protein KIT25_00550 [Enhydrobacter sp.]